MSEIYELGEDLSVSRNSLKYPITDMGPLFYVRATLDQIVRPQGARFRSTCRRDFTISKNRAEWVLVSHACLLEKADLGLGSQLSHEVTLRCKEHLCMLVSVR
jgi:hypothetical protein